MKLSALFQKIGFIISIITVFLLPLFFLPLTSEFYEFNKQALISVSALALLLLWTASSVSDKQVRITRSPFGVPFLAIAASWLLSTFIKTPNRVDAFLEPANTTTVISLVIFFFTAINFIRTRRELETLAHAFTSSLAILALVTLFWATGIAERFMPLAFLKTPLWTPTGNPISTLSLLLGFVPFLAVSVIKTHEQSVKTLALSITMFLCLVSSAVLGYRLFRPATGNTLSPVFLPQSISWAIALESLKTSPLLGTGPATYLADFSQYRPLNHNLTRLWNVRFSTASNHYLHLLTTVGLFGLLSYTFLTLRGTSVLLRVFHSTADSPLHTTSLAAFASASLIFVSQIFLPATITTLAFVVFLLIIGTLALKLSGSSLVHEANIDIVATSEAGSRSPLLPTISFILAIAVALPAFYLGGRAYFAETIFFKATQAAARNDGKSTYDALLSAISANPFQDSYRLAYSQTNLLLANSISNKKDITDQDRTLITQLIQQAIREAKNAVALNSAKVANVENLAVVYRNLIGLAEGADVWTIASYRQAVTLDPTNPNLRIALGGVYFALKNYDEAARVFQSAVDLKPDLANAHYNLAAAFREQGRHSQAFASLQNTLNLVDRSSADYTKVQAEIDDIRQKMGEAAAPTPAAAPAKSNLESPQPLPSPKISPPIKLPADLGPNSTPTPQP